MSTTKKEFQPCDLGKHTSAEKDGLFVYFASFSKRKIPFVCRHNFVKLKLHFHPLFLKVKSMHSVLLVCVYIHTCSVDSWIAVSQTEFDVTHISMPHVLHSMTN